MAPCQASAAVALFCSVLFAQGPSPSDPNTPSFRSAVNLVTVPVVVRDHDGRAVRGLPKEAFQLLDEGRPQQIVSFSEETAPAAAAFPNHFIAYVFDDVAVAAPEEMELIRGAAAGRVAHVNSDERVAIATASCRVLLDFGSDAAKLQASIDELRNTPVPLCRAPATEELEISVMKSVVQRMSTLPGQRRIVFISPGFRLRREAQPSLDQLVNFAAAAKVSIDVLEIGRLSGGHGSHHSGELWGTSSQNVILADGTSGEMAQPSPTYSPEPMPHPSSGDQVTGVLRDLTRGTGGTLVEGGNKLDAAFRRLAPPDSYYLLGFIPQNLEGGNRFHPLKVKLHAEGKVSVQSRSGYYSGAR